MKIWTLVENTTCQEDLIYEHGLSLYLETGGKHILFDTGQTGVFAENARRMGVDLQKVDFAVLSHGHYDHGGGLKRFLQENDHAKVYVNQFAFESHWNGAEKNIGLAPELQDSPRIQMVREDLELSPGVKLCLCKEMQTVHPIESFGLNVLRGNQMVPEDFRHEQYLLAEETGKRILLSGCSHRGILNIVKWFQPDVLIGGFHFKKLDPVADRGKLEAAANCLMQYPTRYYTCHCTGKAQYEVLKERMGDRLSYLSTGSVLTI